MQMEQGCRGPVVVIDDLPHVCASGGAGRLAKGKDPLVWPRGTLECANV